MSAGPAARCCSALRANSASTTRRCVAGFSGSERSRSLSCSSPTVAGIRSETSTCRAVGRSDGFRCSIQWIRRQTCAIVRARSEGVTS